jgi:hypothetical protein
VKCEHGNERHAIHMVGDQLAATKSSVLKKMEDLEGLTEECQIVASLRAWLSRRSSMWKKGTGEEEPAIGVPPGSFTTTPSTVHGDFALGDVRIPGSVVGEHLGV